MLYVFGVFAVTARIKRFRLVSVKACRVAALSDIAERVKRFRLVFACVPFLV